MQIIKEVMENWGVWLPEVAPLQGPALRGFQLGGVGNHSCPTGMFSSGTNVQPSPQMGV